MTTPQGRDAPRISFEFFPPSSTKANLRLWRTVERLAPLNPDFVSVTYGAGGSTRERTYAALMTIRERARLNVAGHLTCVDASREETLAVAEKYRAMGVTRIVALRGDPQGGQDTFTPHPDGFASGTELVEGLAKAGGFDISVAAYPEVHPEATSLDADIQALKAKQDAGANRAITQFFFSKDHFLTFRDKAVAAGVTIPILPGILPIENFDKMSKFAARCGTDVPAWLGQAFSNAKTEEDQTLLATAVASEMSSNLMDEGVEHIHIYTLNNPDLSYDVARAIGVQPNGLSMAAGAA